MVGAVFGCYFLVLLPLTSSPDDRSTSPPEPKPEEEKKEETKEEMETEYV